MTEFQKDIFSLIKSALSGEAVSISENFNWVKAKKLGFDHKILPLLLQGTTGSDITIPTEFETELSLGCAKYFLQSEKQLYELKNITSRFNEAKIEYIVLKGAEQKFFYPSPELRPMGDIDILIKLNQYDIVKSIMLEQGYTEDKESDHEFVWVKDGMMVELHKRIIPSYNEDYYKYFGDGWNMANPVQPNSNIYAFSPEDNFLYLFTHFSKHYRDAGIGILHLVDLYVYLNHYKNLDRKYIEKELKALKLFVFYKNILLTLDACFNGASSTPVTEHIIDKVFGSGSYGTATAQAISIAVKKTKNTKNKRNIRAVLFFKRVFMPYKEMCRRHAVLEKWPVLLPFLWVYRIVSVTLFESKHIKNELQHIKVSDADSVIQYHNDLKFVGLDFNFDE